MSEVVTAERSDSEVYDRGGHFDLMTPGCYRYTGYKMGARPSDHNQVATAARRDVVNCTGTELDIGSCLQHTTPQDKSCEYYGVVAVSCMSGKDDLSSY